MTFSMRLRGPTASFWLALLIVSGAFIAYFVALVAHYEDPEFTPLAAPLMPAFFIAFGLGGGPHGLPGKWWYDVPVTFIIALAMWWAVLESCRRLWNARRR